MNGWMSSRKGADGFIAGLLSSAPTWKEFNRIILLWEGP